MFKNKNIFFLIMRYKVKETVSNTSHINCSENKGMTTICISVNIFGPQFVLFMCVSLVDFLHYYNIINQQLRKISATTMCSNTTLSFINTNTISKWIHYLWSRKLQPSSGNWCTVKTIVVSFPGLIRMKKQAKSFVHTKKYCLLMIPPKQD